MKLTKKLKRKLQRRIGFTCIAGIALVCVSVLTLDTTDDYSLGFVDSIKRLVENIETGEEKIPSSETKLSGVKINRNRI